MLRATPTLYECFEFVFASDVWDGLLETRIKLHKVLSACNQLPQGDALGQFTKAGGRQTEESVEECESVCL